MTDQSISEEKTEELPERNGVSFAPESSSDTVSEASAAQEPFTAPLGPVPVSVASFFYFDRNNQKQGPVGMGQLKELAAQGRITPQTPMETNTGYKGVAGQVPELTFGTVPPNPFSQSPFSQPAPAPTENHRGFLEQTTVNIRAYIMQSSGASPEAQRVNAYFKWYWISAVVWILQNDIFYLIGGFSWARGSGSFLRIINDASMAAMLVFGYVLLYQLWKLVSTDIARTTPDKAVGFCFIPVFNLYWRFIAFLGLCKDMNKTLRQRGIQYCVSESLGMTFCILCIVFVCAEFIESSLVYLHAYEANWFTWFARSVPIFIRVACSIIGIFLFKSLKDGGIALLEHGEVVKN